MDALIVASTIQQQHALSDVMYKSGIDCVVCSSAAEARRESLCRPFDIFIVNGGLPDERGNELSMSLAETNDCGGIYIDDFARVDMFGDDLGKTGVISLVRPLTKTALGDAVRMLLVANVRVQTLRIENSELKSKLEDEKYVFRAKILLMRALGYTEDQAHKFIEKKAMDNRQSRRKVAMEILKNYEA